VLLLSRFLERLDDVRFAKQDVQAGIHALQMLKKFKAEYPERISILRKSFEGTMTTLESCVRYYEASEEQLAKQLTGSPINFVYDLNMELDYINE